MLTGRTASAAPGLVFYDAWEIAGQDLLPCLGSLPAWALPLARCC
jgi:hypothetical protein